MIEQNDDIWDGDEFDETKNCNVYFVLDGNYISQSMIFLRDK